MNALHAAATDGSVDRTVAIISNGRIDIDQGSPEGITPLMCATVDGHAPVVRILLSKKANSSIVNDDGCTALVYAAAQGDVTVTKMLLAAGADIEPGGISPLYLAAQAGHTDVMKVLIEAGANVCKRETGGEYPLFTAAYKGHVAAVRQLLHAKSDPLLTVQNSEGGQFNPLEVAAELGHSGVVRELLQKVGIEGCGGASGGYDALWSAAQGQHVDVMRLLTDAGVADTGKVLNIAAGAGLEASVKFLVQQQPAGKSSDRGSCLDVRGVFGTMPLIRSIVFCHPRSPRIVQLLVDAGVDTTSAVPIPRHLLDEVQAGHFVNITPLALTTSCLRERKLQGNDATKEELHTLEAIRRLLLRVEAVLAVSWLWPSLIPAVADPPEGSTRSKTAPMTSGAPLRMVLPIPRKRTERRDVLLAALFR